MAFAAMSLFPASCVRALFISPHVMRLVTGQIILMSSFTDGDGEGFGNRISIQTVAIVRAAEAVKRVYSVDTGRPVGGCLHHCLSSQMLTIPDLAGMPCSRQHKLVPGTPAQDLGGGESWLRKERVLSRLSRKRCSKSLSIYVLFKTAYCRKLSGMIYTLPCVGVGQAKCCCRRYGCRGE